jgi:hypothetical protein
MKQGANSTRRTVREAPAPSAALGISISWLMRAVCHIQLHPLKQRLRNRKE